MIVTHQQMQQRELPTKTPEEVREELEHLLGRLETGRQKVHEANADIRHRGLEHYQTFWLGLHKEYLHLVDELPAAEQGAWFDKVHPLLICTMLDAREIPLLIADPSDFAANDEDDDNDDEDEEW